MNALIYLQSYLLFLVQIQMSIVVKTGVDSRFGRL